MSQNSPVNLAWHFFNHMAVHCHFYLPNMKFGLPLGHWQATTCISSSEYVFNFFFFFRALVMCEQSNGVTRLLLVVSEKKKIKPCLKINMKITVRPSLSLSVCLSIKNTIDPLIYWSLILLMYLSSSVALFMISFSHLLYAVKREWKAESMYRKSSVKPPSLISPSFSKEENFQAPLSFKLSPLFRTIKLINGRLYL